MEPNDHFNYTALPTANTISSLKAEKLLTNGSSLASPPHKNGVNGNMNVNGLTAVSSTSTSGTLTSTTHSNKSSLMHHPNVAYDYLWNHTQCRSANSVNLNPKDNQLVPQFHALGPYQQNGLAESLRPATMRDPELWGKGTRSSMELGFTSPELYDSYHDDGFEPLKNGPSDFYSTPRPSPMLASSVQAFATSPCQEQESSQLGDDCVKDILPIAVGETVELESLEPSDEQTDLKLCNYNGTSSPINPLDIPVVPPPPDVTSCLDDSSQLSSQLDESHLLSSEGLEPFGTDLSRDSVGGGLYDLEETVSEVEQTSLGGPADLSSLDCTDTPSFANTTSFSMLTEDSQNSTSLFAATAASSVLEDSVMQDDGCSELQSELEADVESDREPDLSLNLQNISQEEVVGGRSKEPVADEELVHDGSSTEAVADEELVQDGSTAGDNQRRRAATAEEVYFPIKHGWRREVHIRKGNNRWQGETSYYAPCGKRMKQFPEVIKYLSRNPCAHVRREHFSFSPRMPVGDFYEEASTAEGLKWVKLASEEIPSCILAITGKRGRPRSIEKLKAKVGTRLKRGRGRPPKVKAVDLLNKADSKLMELEPQEELNREDKVVLRKIKKMRRKERDKRKQDVKAAALKEAEKQAKLEKKTEKVRREKQDKEKEKVKLEQENVNIPEEEKLCIPEQETVNVAVERKLETQRRLEEVAQRKLEERRRQHLILEEMKKSTEDMCLVDHQPLPEFTRIPGLFLPSSAFADCLTVVEFLHSYGKVLGFDVPKEVPSLCTLQEGLFNVGDSLGELMDLLIRLLRLALRDPGMPSYCQSLKVLGDKISELELNRDTVSEVLRIFMEVYGADLEICNSLRSKPFQAHPPETKAAILAFLVNELNGSTTIICEIDKTLENMSKQRRNKWIIEGRLRRLRIALAKKMGRPESEISRMEQPWRRRKLRAAAEQEEGDDRCLGAVGMDALDESVQVKRSVKEEEELRSRDRTGAYMHSSTEDAICWWLNSTEPCQQPTLHQFMNPEKGASEKSSLSAWNQHDHVVNDEDSGNRLLSISTNITRSSAAHKQMQRILDIQRNVWEAYIPEELPVPNVDIFTRFGCSGESPSSASALELERQIEKLTKRQTFFRRKLLHASQGLRAVSLGQDRYRRHYWVLPHLGGIFVEGMDGTQAPHDDFSEEREESFLPVVPKLSPIKSEPTEMLIRDKTSNSNHRRRGRPRKPKVEREVLLTLLSPTSPFGLGQQQQQSSFPPLKVELPSPQPLQQKPPPPQPLRLPSPQSQQLLPSLSLQQKQDSPPPLWHELPSPQSLKQEPSSPSPLPFPQSLQSPPSLSLRQKPDSPPPLQQEPPSPQLLKQELPPPLPSSQSLESQPSLSLKQKPDSPPPLRPPSPQFLKQESPPHLPLRLPAPQLLQSPASLALQPELPSPLPLQQEQPLPRPLHLPFPQPPFSQILQHKPDYFPPPRRQTPSPPPPRVPYKKKRKHSSKSKVANGFFEEAILISQSQVDLSQSAFLSFLSQTQNSLLDSSMLTPASSPGNPETSPIPPEEILETYPETDIVDTESARQGSEKLGQWFHLLPRKPCNVSSVDPTKTTSTENAASEAPHPCDTFCPTATTCKLKMRRTSCSSRECLPVDVPTHVPTISTPIHNTRAHNPLRKIAVIPADTQHSPRDVCNGPSPVKRRGRPPTKFLKQIEQKYFTQLTRHPIPKAMKIGWWWIRDPEQFEAVLKVLHPRGIREKTLQKHLTKHKDYLKEVCLRPSNDPIFKYIPDAGHPVCPMTLQKWSTVERALEVDLPILQWVEELEQRVVFSDLQLRGWMLPPLDSTREDLQYYEHKVDPSEDITIRLKKEGMELWRVNTHPLDRAVQRLADLELNIERRYLKEPLWLLSEVVTEKLVLTDSEDGEVTQTEVEYAITPRLRTWRQTVERCRSAAQLSLCIYQLDKSIAWEKSVNKVICLVCRKGDNDELLLLCESCDRGCHTYCHRPKISEIPSEDWFCPICISRQADGEYLWTQSTLHRGTKRRVVPPSSLLDDGITKNAMTMRRRDNCGMGVSRYSGEGLSPSKRRRMSVRNDDNSDLAFCEIILMEMEAQDDAWPFLEPVNPRLVPGYRKIIKKPMDFSTMREKLLSGGYSCCEEFAADAMLVFNNCQMFNEDDSEVGRAGLVMKCFYESRWEEFYRGKMEENM